MEEIQRGHGVHPHPVLLGESKDLHPTMEALARFWGFLLDEILRVVQNFQGFLPRRITSDSLNNWAQLLQKKGDCYQERNKGRYGHQFRVHWFTLSH